MQVHLFNPFYKSFGLCTLGSLFLLFFSCGDPAAGSFTVQNDTDLPAGTLLSVSLPTDTECCTDMKLKAVDSGNELELQQASTGEIYFLLDAPLAAGTSREYELVPVSGSETTGLHTEQTETGLDISSAGHPVLTYNTATLSPPEGLPDYYQRSGFIHPFYSPSGKVLTDGFPAGHTHQHGIFFAWVNTTYRGDFTDFWNQQKETGTVAFRELTTSESGPVFAYFQSRHEAISLQHGPVLDETWDVKTYAIPDYHVIDLTTTQQIIGKDTLFINKYHYGGMGIRLAAEWNEVDSTRYTGPMQVLTSKGVTNRDSANHSRPNWTAVYGQIDGSVSGVAMFDHPSNFRHPQPVRVHPSMPYFVQTPMLEAAFEQVPGETYSYTYRILSFDGEPDAAQLDAMWEAYASEAAVSWKE
ncbi:DUF6807 domain-containing protein [Flavilitoribacter nigricans]|uniref:DUF4861 domain-containing protein n=1 Tax=Flavilitoribacter nigricans (strain ATCC 23147 / DSM 23189 / NBRC 102662 / NCIMB 1420 / SS-2) TaxID=1122177 RepID=A0A2D0NAL8_FLAN2|nr:PmoA family protein [Flavilitoribacter nigricans]PHN05562.1 hypothetical protein CRP01_16355 [Flavilitoribacter nigricans DSM 23189 = NBRC 102662]